MLRLYVLKYISDLKPADFRHVDDLIWNLDRAYTCTHVRPFSLHIRSFALPSALHDKLCRRAAVAASIQGEQVTHTCTRTHVLEFPAQLLPVIPERESHMCESHIESQCSRPVTTLFERWDESAIRRNCEITNSNDWKFHNAAILIESGKMLSPAILTRLSGARGFYDRY